MKNGIVIGGFVPNFVFQDAAPDFIEDLPSDAFSMLERNFSFESFWYTGKTQKRFMLWSRKEESITCIWVANVLLMFRLASPYEEKANSILEHIKCSLPLDSVDQILICVCLRCSKNVKVNYYLIQPGSTGGTTLFVGECFMH